MALPKNSEKTLALRSVVVLSYFSYERYLVIMAEKITERVQLKATVPASLRQAIKIKAAERGVTMEDFIERALRAALKSKEAVAA